MRVYNAQTIDMLSYLSTNPIPSRKATQPENAIIEEMVALGCMDRRLEEWPFGHVWIARITPRGRTALRCHAALMGGDPYETLVLP